MSDFTGDNINFLQSDRINIATYIQSVVGKTRLIIVLFIVGGTLSGLVTNFFIDSLYTATSKLYIVSSSSVSDSSINLSDLQVSSALVADYKEIVLTRSVIEKSLENLGLGSNYTYDDIISNIEVTIPSDTRFLTISVSTSNPRHSMDIANEIARQTVSTIDELLNVTPPEIIETASYPTEKSSPNMLENIISGGAIFAFAYVLYLLAIFAFNNKIKTPGDVKQHLGDYPICTIPADAFQFEKKKQLH